MKKRVEYITSKHNGKTYRYPYLVSSYRDENGVPQRKIITKLSSLPEHAIEALRVSLKNQGEKENSNQKVDIDAINFSRSQPFGAYWAVSQLMQQTGVTKALEVLKPEHQAAIQTSIVDRVINPKPYSKNALARYFHKSILQEFTQARPSEGDWYKALEQLYENQQIIEKKLYRESVNQIYLYDITSSYFEGERCPLSSLGYNRDEKKGKMQIVVGLITNEAGMPISVKVFEGNTTDQTTVMEQVRNLKESFGIEELIFVGDRGMITGKRIEELEEETFNWCSYISAINRSDILKLAEKQDHPLQVGLFDNNELIEVKHQGRRYVLCRNPQKAEESALTREKLLENTEEKLAGIANSVKHGRLKHPEKIAKRLHRWLNKWNMAKFFEVDYDYGQFSYRINEAELARQKQLDGCYVIVSDVDENVLDKNELHAKYKDLKFVESAFRSMKTADLFIRPIRHWNPLRVKGHVFMCMLAYRTIWFARQRLAPVLQEEDTLDQEVFGLREVWDELNNITVGIMTVEGIQLKQFSDQTSTQVKLLRHLKTPIGKKAEKFLENMTL